MDIGAKLKRLRIRLGLTQDELAARTELSKGFISQVERNQASPSIATLIDILEALGTDLSGFFAEKPVEKVAFEPDDMFVKDDAELKHSICWLVPNAQKNELEPILLLLEAGGSSPVYDPHEGEEFGYVLKGTATLVLGNEKTKVRRGGSFCFKPSLTHSIINTGKSECQVIWVATPPSF